MQNAKVQKPLFAALNKFLQAPKLSKDSMLPDGAGRVEGPA